MRNYLSVSIRPTLLKVSVPEPETLPAWESLVSITIRHPAGGRFALIAVSGFRSLQFRILQEALQ